jgi:hypothetical protein
MVGMIEKSDKTVPFIVRRARLLLGLPREQFAALYGVDETKVYQWELGLEHPNPKTWSRLRNLTLSAGSLLDEDLIRVSPLYKVLVDIEDLTSPIVASKGINEVVEAVGALKGEGQPMDAAELAHGSPQYEISGIRALEIIQADPRWQAREIVYAEAHCVSLAIGGVWIDAMIAPLPGRIAALFEFAISRRGPEGGFWVHLVGLQDMPFNQPQ